MSTGIPAEDLSRQVVILQGQNYGELNEELTSFVGFKGEPEYLVIIVLILRWHFIKNKN